MENQTTGRRTKPRVTSVSRGSERMNIQSWRKKLTHFIASQAIVYFIVMHVLFVNILF